MSPWEEEGHTQKKYEYENKEVNNKLSVRFSHFPVKTKLIIEEEAGLSLRPGLGVFTSQISNSFLSGGNPCTIVDIN